MGNVLKYEFLGGILKESSNVLYLFFAVCRSVVLSSFQNSAFRVAVCSTWKGLYHLVFFSCLVPSTLLTLERGSKLSKFTDCVSDRIRFIIPSLLVCRPVMVLFLPSLDTFGRGTKLLTQALTDQES